MMYDLIELAYEAKWHNRTKRRRSYWRQGVEKYIDSIIYERYAGERYVDIDNPEVFLNGAKSWREYSYSGNALIYDQDIAMRLCTPSEYAKKKEGILPPNGFETWLDVQARALAHAYISIMWAWRRLR